MLFGYGYMLICDCHTNKSLFQIFIDTFIRLFFCAMFENHQGAGGYRLVC